MSYDTSSVSLGRPTKKSDYDRLLNDIIYLYNDLIPIGVPIPWHKDMPGVPALPDIYLECDGSVIVDSDSPMNGETLPDLNGDLAFVRGGTTSSNTKQDDAFQGHRHNGGSRMHSTVNYFYSQESLGAGTSTGASTPGTSRRHYTGNPTTDTANGTPRTTTETRPINMTMIMIMRIK